MDQKSDDEEWHIIHIPRMGTAWIGWGKAKNKQVMLKHEVSFEAMLLGLLENGIADIREHPNTTRYPNQHILCVEISGYIHRCPCLYSRSAEDEPCFFLKTIYPNGKDQRALRE